MNIRALFFFIILSCPGLSLARVIDFDGPPRQPSNTSFGLFKWDEDGFTFIDPFPKSYTTMSRTGPATYRRPDNGTAHFNPGFVDFYALNGKAFRLISVDLAEYSTEASSDSITFTGFKANGTRVETTFNLDGVMDGDGPLVDFQNFQFGPEFSDIVKVKLRSFTFSMDNLVLTVNGETDGNDDAFHLPVDQLQNLPVLANDTGVTLAITAVTQGSSGSVSHNGSTVTYTPGTQWNGSDTFTYTVTSGNAAPAVVTVRLANDAPATRNDTAEVEAGLSLVVPVLANDFDTDGDSLLVASAQVEPASEATVTVEGDGVRFTAPPNFSGNIPFSYVASDGHGGRTVGHAVVKVTSSVPVAVKAYGEGEPVPRRGMDVRIPSQAVWSGFGQPAVNDSGKIAFIGKWRASAPRSLQTGTGIFVDDVLLVKTGDAVPGAGTTLPANATFKNFKDPVIDATGGVAFLATIQGSGITTVNDTVVVTNGRIGQLEVLAQKGRTAPGTGSVFKSFTSVSIHRSAIYTSEVLFTATLALQSGAPAANDTGVWMLPGGIHEVLLLIREGELLGTETVKSITLLQALDGSPAHGRGQLDEGKAHARLTVARGTNTRQVLVHAAREGFSERLGTGRPVRSTLLRGARWKTMNLPSSSNDGAFLSMLGRVSVSYGETSFLSEGVFQSETYGYAWEPVARVGGTAPGIGAGVTFSRFKNPVSSTAENGVAFIASVRGRSIQTASNDGIWWLPGEGPLTLLAREGAQPPGAPLGTKWAAFTSLAMPGGSRGPIFTAKLQAGAGGITSSDDAALYGVDSTGTLHQLLRERQPLRGKTVASFNVLKAVGGSAGVGRSFNADAQVVALVSFTDGSTAIVRVHVP